MDEARLGQQGTLTRVWARTGSRPTAVRQTKYEWVYLYAAVEPATGESVALLAPNADTGTMNVFLRMLSQELKEAEHAVLVLDGAGWHKSKNLVVPDNVTCLLLPPYSPELNPAERLFEEVRRHVEGRVYATLADKVAAVNDFLDELDADPARVRSLCGWAWIDAAIATLPAPLEKAA